ncbi:hypothetical protein A2118_02755 [Candidatus Kaiserbacteria bacterium GWA2_50_9]|uniref:Uncharacterized protein n=1 Tax=Candidatus Kaiserbacteria bacterium GWA2_50_9 TaxID=1798474 RepID=A0A1F6BTZ5_9BACT|nr:MAG: hypothetical protein A2118_02755 [Candidatus Kaiserbacteria bacterium GWA2_50_9]
MEGVPMGKNMQPDLQAALEKAAVSRKAFMEKHPKFLKENKPPASKPTELEKMFGKEGAARMRDDAERNAWQDGEIDK